MLNNPMLDVVIGLIFFYILLSIVITVLQEFISSSLKWRSKNLQTAIVELIGKENKNSFFNHPLILPLFRGGVDDQGNPIKGGPAYIPRRNFALAVFDLQRGKGRSLTKTAAGGMASLPAISQAVNAETPTGDKLPPAFALARFFINASVDGTLGERIKQFDATATGLIDNISNQTVKKAATHALAAAVGELKTATDVVDTAVKEIELLFDSAMDRAAGWYKVGAQRMALLISVVLAVALNADTIYVAQRLWQDDALRARSIAAAEAFYKNNEMQTLTSLCKATVLTDKNNTESMTAADLRKVADCTQKEIKNSINQLTAAGYPIGWPLQPGQDPYLAAVGFILTGLALSLGSSFWFDLLGKFMNIRMTGKREDTASSPPVRGG